MVQLLDGKATASTIREELALKVACLKGRKPKLSVLLVGQEVASHIYVRNKVKACQEVGIEVEVVRFDASVTQDLLLKQIEELNSDGKVDGILVQLPLPLHIDTAAVVRFVDPAKDVDGLHPINSGKLVAGDPTAFAPCTPRGIYELLRRYEIETTGAHLVILGRSTLVGKSLALLMMQKGKGADCTVTLAHSRSRDLPKLCKEADILVAAMGQPQLVGVDYVRRGAVVVDVGINSVELEAADGKRKIVGDVDFNSVAERCSYISPVPGGVGPMTIAMLLANVLQAYSMNWQSNP